MDARQGMRIDEMRPDEIRLEKTEKARAVLARTSADRVKVAERRILILADGQRTLADITAALDLVQAAKTRTELDKICSEHGAKATAAKDAGGYRALKAACRERAAEIEQVTDVQAKEPQHA